MSAQFTVTPLVGGASLVEGTDAAGREGTTVLRSETWNEVVRYQKQVQAVEAFDEKVDEFFAPLLDAAEALKADEDETGWDVVVLKDEVEGVDHDPEVRIKLDTDGTVLRVLAEGDHDQLRWVGGDLVVVA
jgi:hypothetical protein